MELGLQGLPVLTQVSSSVCGNRVRGPGGCVHGGRCRRGADDTAPLTPSRPVLSPLGQQEAHQQVSPQLPSRDSGAPRALVRSGRDITLRGARFLEGLCPHRV